MIEPQWHPMTGRARPLLTVLAAVIAFTAALTPAHAQGLSGSVGNLAVNSDAPIRIEADTLEIDEPKSIATFSGRVKASQDNMTLNTDRLVVHYSASNAGEGASLRSVDARGRVVMKVDDQTARGDHAHYDLTKEEVTLSGEVILSQGDNAIRGEKIIVDLKTGRARMVATTEASGGRVRGVFTPNRQ